MTSTTDSHIDYTKDTFIRNGLILSLALSPVTALLDLTDRMPVLTDIYNWLYWGLPIAVIFRFRWVKRHRRVTISPQLDETVRNILLIPYTTALSAMIYESYGQPSTVNFVIAAVSFAGFILLPLVLWAIGRKELPTKERNKWYGIITIIAISAILITPAFYRNDVGRNGWEAFFSKASSEILNANQYSHDWQRMDMAEQLMATNPDSALRLMNKIDTVHISRVNLSRHRLLTARIREKLNLPAPQLSAAVELERRALALEAVEEVKRKENVVMLGAGAICFMVVVASLIFVRYRTVKQREEALALELERNELQSENHRLQIARLEDESASLRALLGESNSLSEPVYAALRKRLDMLNALLAREITSNALYAAPYREWVEEVKRDKAQFMASTRMAFEASHPKFITHLEQCGLTEYEMNYLCLYALGLRGKEVGEYIELKRHYNISSDIRKKLGISEHDTNLGLYVRRILKEM